MNASWLLVLAQLILLVPGILIIILIIYALMLSIKALNIYIRKNS